MGNLTPKRAFYLPGGGTALLGGPAEQADIDKINGNFVKLDDLIGLNPVTSTTRPAIPGNGDIIYETDTRNQMYWSAVGARWVPVGTPNAASDVLRDALFPAPLQGNSVYRTDKGWTEAYHALWNAATNPAGATPIGWYPVSGSLPSVHATTDVTAPTLTASFALVALPTELFDSTGAMHDLVTNNSRVTVPVAGRYRYTAKARTGPTGVLGLRVAIGGTGLQRSDVFISPQTGAFNDLITVGTAVMGAGTFMELQASNSVSTALVGSHTSLLLEYVGVPY